MDARFCKQNAKTLLFATKTLLKCLVKQSIHTLICFLILLLSSVTYIFFTNTIIIDTLKIFENNDWKNNIIENLVVVVATIVTLLIGLIIYYSIIRNVIFPFKGSQRNANYLKEQLSSKDRRSPLTSIKQQIERITGKDASIEIKDEIRNNTLKVIEPIKAFVFNEEKTLILDGKWGSGKSSYTLIAINEASSDDKFNTTDFRFIYESAFKYISGFNEFKTDILKAIHAILSEQNIVISGVIRKLANNINPSSFHIPFNAQDGLTTTDYINKLNRKYKRKQRNNCKPFQIIIIIDDVDRLLGDDIVQTISFLSIIRRLDFVKIIIPIDRSVVIRQLKTIGVSDPENYIKKHLPELYEVKVPTNFELFKKIYTQKIRKQFDENMDEEQIQPILETICIKIFSDKLKENMAAVNLRTLGNWQNGIDDYPKQLTEENEYNSEYILNARNLARNKAPNSYKNSISYHTGSNDEFESLIYKLSFAGKRTPLENGHNPLRVDRETYDVCIKSWIVSFSQEHWERVGATMRVVDDIYDKFIKNLDNNYINAGLSPHKIFVRAYNKVLPKWPILDEYLES